MGLISRILASNIYLDNGKSTSEAEEPQTALEKYQELREAERARREEQLEKEKERAEEEKKAAEKRAEEQRLEEQKAQQLEEEKKEEQAKADKLAEEKKAEEKKSEAIKAEKLEEEKKAAELTNDQVQRYMEELREDNKKRTFDTAEETLNKLHAEDELSDKDFKKIISMYNNKYGKGEKEEIINKADDKLRGEHQNSVIGKAAGRLIDEAQEELDNGEKDGKTIQALTKTLQRSSRESIRKAEDFVEAATHGDKEANIEKLQKEYSGYTKEEIEEKLLKTSSLYADDNLVDIIDMYS